MFLSFWWPYLVIFATLFFTGIGLPPLPEEAGIIGAGIAATHSELRWWLAFPACLGGILAADLLLYAIGRVCGPRLFEYGWMKRFLPAERRQKIEEGFHTHGVKILITARLLPGLRTGIFMIAGAIHFSWYRFLLADGLFAIFGVGFLFFGTYFFAEWVKWILEAIVHRVQFAGLFLLAVGVTAFVLYRYVKYMRGRAATGHFEPPELHPLEAMKHPLETIKRLAHLDEKPTQAAENPLADPPAAPSDPLPSPGPSPPAVPTSPAPESSHPPAASG